MAAVNSTAPTLTAKQVARFWSKVAVAGPDECWPWTGRLPKRGYGYFRVGPRKMRVHILARYLSTGEWPGTLETLHNCPGGDLPCCCNPRHLWVGSHADNMRDMVAKGRNKPNQVRGERQGQAKLTADDVLEIRRLYATGDTTVRKLAARFGVCSSAIHHILKRVNWHHLP